MSAVAHSDSAAAESHVETLKRASTGLGGALLEEMPDLNTANLSEDASILLKFHGSYQQDDRDARQARKKAGQDRLWQFMVRTKTPGGRMTAEQYLLADELATKYANGTLRITTRQAIQFHGIGKAHLKPLIKELNERWVTTYGACGDVARNVLTCPVADLLPHNHFDLQDLAQRISDRFLPESTSYYELWLDGEKVLADGKKVKVEPSRSESFYGATYMPRKHKMGIGLPHDNCIDIFTHDLALEAIVDDGNLIGFNLVAGGGLGSTHNKHETFPRLGDRVGYLPADKGLEVIEAASAVYRDYGDRNNRKHARLKYVLEDRGVAWYRNEVDTYLGWKLADPVPVPEYGVHDHLGWEQQGDGNWLVGVWVENGRVKENVRAGLRTIVQETQAEVRLTAQQNIVLARITPEAKPRVEALIAEYGLATAEGEQLSALRRWAMACPSMPTCGLAVAEAERYLPSLIGELEARGFANERVWIRMSGCPNSCSRPPSAEIGLIGRSLNMYNLYVGGSFAGTRLAKLYRAGVRTADLPNLLAELMGRWRTERTEGESFGDWSNRTLVPNGDWHNPQA